VLEVRVSDRDTRKDPAANEAAVVDRLTFALVERPDRLTTLMLAGMEPAERSEVVATSEAMASLALGEAPIAPPPRLRDRLMATLRARKAERPRKAILVVDMINDHLTPGRVLEVPRARDVVPALVARLEGARAEKIPVVYVLDRHKADDPELDEWGQHAIEGTEGAEVWPPLAPKPGDLQVVKGSFSAFYQTELERVLEELRVDTLELTGCATEVQLMATATDALQRGFKVELPPGLHAGASPVAEQVAMGVLQALVPYAPSRRARMERLRAHP
jgi:nicotinamidase-related amidase